MRLKLEKANQNLMGYEKKQSRIGLSDKNEHMKEQDKVGKEEKVQKEEMRVYQPPVPFP